MNPFPSDADALRAVVHDAYAISRPLVPGVRIVDADQTAPASSDPAESDLRNLVRRLATRAKEVEEWLLAQPDAWRKAGSPYRPGGTRHLPTDVYRMLQQLQLVESILEAPEPLQRLDFIAMILERRITAIDAADQLDEVWRSYQPRTKSARTHPKPDSNQAYPLVLEAHRRLLDFDDEVARFLLILDGLPEIRDELDDRYRRRKYYFPRREVGEQHFAAVQEKRWRHTVTNPEDLDLYHEYDLYHQVRMQILALKPIAELAVDSAASSLDADAPISLDRVSFRIRRAIAEVCDALPDYAVIGDTPPRDLRPLVASLTASRRKLRELLALIRPMAECIAPAPPIADQAKRNTPAALAATSQTPAPPASDPWRNRAFTVNERVQHYMVYANSNGSSVRPSCRDLADILDVSEGAVAGSEAWRTWGGLLIEGKTAERPQRRSRRVSNRLKADQIDRESGEDD